MPRLYVVDTNVVVSGVLSFGWPSAPALIVAGMVDGRTPFLLSADLLAEYRRVLLRPLIVARHGLAPAQIDSLVAAFATGGYLRQPSDEPQDPSDAIPRCPAGDEHIGRLLAHELWSVLVSGDAELMRAVQGWRETLSPAEAAREPGLS